MTSPLAKHELNALHFFLISLLTLLDFSFKIRISTKIIN
jgi:hypothetical protein